MHEETIHLSDQRCPGRVHRADRRWLVDPPDVHEALHRSFDDEGVAKAHPEVEQLRAELEQWRQMAEQRQVTPVSFASMEQSLTKQIADAERQATDAALPPVLRGWLGPHAAADWARLKGVAVKREIIREVLDIRLKPQTPNQNAFGMHRLSLRWRWEATEQSDRVIAVDDQVTPKDTVLSHKVALQTAA